MHRLLPDSAVDWDKLSPSGALASYCHPVPMKSANPGLASLPFGVVRPSEVKPLEHFSVILRPAIPLLETVRTTIHSANFIPAYGNMYIGGYSG